MKRVFVGCALLLMLQSCSFAFVSGPPTNHERMREFSCTEDGAGPAADTTFAVSSAAAAYITADAREEGWRLGTITNLAAAAIYGGSALYGVIKTYDCRAAQRVARARRDREHTTQQERITELEAALAGARCETSSDCRSDRVCNDHRCIAVPSPPTTSDTPAPGEVQLLEITPPSGVQAPAAAAPSGTLETLGTPAVSVPAVTPAPTP